AENRPSDRMFGTMGLGDVIVGIATATAACYRIGLGGTPNQQDAGDEKNRRTADPGCTEEGPEPVGDEPAGRATGVSVDAEARSAENRPSDRMFGTMGLGDVIVGIATATAACYRIGLGGTPNQQDAGDEKNRRTADPGCTEEGPEPVGDEPAGRATGVSVDAEARDHADECHEEAGEIEGVAAAGGGQGGECARERTRSSACRCGSSLGGSFGRATLGSGSFGRSSFLGPTTTGGTSGRGHSARTLPVPVFDSEDIASIAHVRAACQAIDSTSAARRFPARRRASTRPSGSSS